MKNDCVYKYSKIPPELFFTDIEPIEFLPILKTAFLLSALHPCVYARKTLNSFECYCQRTKRIELYYLVST